MCAIFGALLNNIDDREKSDKVQYIINHIMLKSTARGRDGYGWYSHYDRGLSGAEDSYKSISKINAVDGLVGPNISELHTGVIVGNFRAEPTTEYVRNKTQADQQPYTDADWTLVHNGTVANDAELRSHRVSTTIDSAAIVEHLALMTLGELPVCDAFEVGVKAIVGSYAILAAHKNHPNKIFVATNYRPIWYAATPEGIFFASAKEYFPEFMVPVMISPYSGIEFSYSAGIANSHCFTLRPPSLTPVPRSLIIASGGLDSTVAAASCIAEGHDITLLHFKYGCRAEGKEDVAIKSIAASLGVPLVLFPLNIYDPKDSRLFDADATIAGGEEGAEYAHEWVPARNLVMLSVATAYAEANGFDYIVLGNNMEEAGAYPDNEPEFIRKFNDLLPFAVGVDKRVEVLMPVGDMMKHEIVALGQQVHAPMDLTWSCYKKGELHCGKCGPCFMRRTSFEINGIKEVITYEE